MEGFDIETAVRARMDEMISERRHFHRHPELSGMETETCRYLMDQLEALGCHPVHVEAGGIIGQINPDAPGPAVLLRADMDALPIQESEHNLNQMRQCRSERDGVMHACGHDAHTAMLLCATRILCTLPLRVPVIIVFEQGEENNSGVRKLAPYLKEHYDIAFCYGTHVRWDIPAGQVAICDGAALAGCFGFNIAIHGQGGHGSRPDLARSPIDCFTLIHNRLNMLRMTCVEPDQVLTYSLGTVHAGEALNVIPDTLTFSGSVRTFDAERSAERFAAEMKQIVESTCQSCGCEAEYLHFSRPLYETRNHPEVRFRLLAAAKTQLPSIEIVDAKPWMASETMSTYLHLWPGAYSFTGIRNEALGCGAGHHTAEFDLDESAMFSGACMAVMAALEWNRNPSGLPVLEQKESMEQLLERSL